VKVLEQIVDYLARQSALTPEEITAIEAAGFIRSAGERRDDWDDLPECGDEEPPLRPRPGPRGRKSPPLRAAVLATRVRSALEEVDPHLHALACIAPRQTEDRWEQIAALVRAPPEALAGPIAVAIDRGATSFRALWDAIGADQHRTLVRADEHGPAATAYRAMTALRDHRAIGKHVWILRRRAFARIHELSRAQDRAVEGIDHLHRERPALVGKWISQDPHPVAYWTFVLLYNAERAARGTPWHPFSGEQPARRRLPSTHDFAQAWARAIQLRGATVARFLESYGRAEATSLQLAKALSPRGPHLLAEDWLRAELAARAEEAGHRPRVLEAMLALRRFDFAPAQRLVEAGIVAAREPEPAADPEEPCVTLFCPGGWN